MSLHTQMNHAPLVNLLNGVGLVLLRLCEALLFLLLAAGMVAFALYHVYGRDLPDPAQLALHRPFETTRIYARDGQTLLYELFDDGQRTVVPLEEVPWALKAATVATEDAHFYENPGIDLRGIVRAFWLNLDGEVRSGGSTITQQLVRNVLLSPDERNEQSYERKLREAILAFQLSRQFSKDQILSFYLNEIYYGNMAYGIEAAAQNYFGKHARELNLAESALLAGLVQSPTHLNPLTASEAAKERQRVVLQSMLKHGYIDQQQADMAYATPIKLRPSTVDIKTPHWVFYVRGLLEQRYGANMMRRGGLRVVTTLDPALQSLTEQAVREQIAQLHDRNANNAAVVVIDPKTGEILAMVGSVDYNDATIDGQVNVALAPRQPGSALKPIVYAAALMHGWTPATIIWDTPTDFDGYQPTNYDNQFHGPQRLRMALANSYNIPAVKALQFVGINAFHDLAEAMGISTLQERERYGLAAALGAGEVTLLDLTQSYTTFANGGVAQPPTAISKVTTSHGEVLYVHEASQGVQVLGPRGDAIAYLISDILSDNDARTPMFGSNSVMRLSDDRPAAVKTGTSNDYRDSWAIGYTPDLAVGVWVGNTDSTPMQEVAGANGAGAIWQQIMERSHAGKPHQPFIRPPNVDEATICASTGLLADSCSDMVAERFVSDALPTPQADQYIMVTLGATGDCLATDLTPVAERQQRTFLVVPPDVQAWTIPQPPTRPCTTPSTSATTELFNLDVVAAIESPSQNAVVGGVVTVLGSAAGSYILNYGAGEQPDTWTMIAQGHGGVGRGLLGSWSTDDLPSGVYTLRLEVALPGNPVQTIESRVVVDRQQMTVRLAQPAPDTRILADTTVQLLAEAGGPATHVEFMVDGEVVGSTPGPIAIQSWVAAGQGSHTLEAIAFDANGQQVSSAPVVVVVE
jgi:1A family penicillin-binding protein